jgi:glucose/arabinose dehydrogenase
MTGGRATGEYIDFMTGLVTPDGDVWGRPVAVAEGVDGALLVTDDAGGCIWRIAYR